MNTMATSRQSPPWRDCFAWTMLIRIPISLPSILIHSAFQGAVMMITVIDPLIYIFYSSFQLLACCCSETALV